MRKTTALLKRSAAALSAVLFMLVSLAAPVRAEQTVQEAVPLPEIASPYCCVMDAETGRVLYDKGMDEPGSPASMTKIMTTYVALKYGNLSDVVTMTQTGVSMAFSGSSNLYTQVGEQFTLEQLLYGTMVKSANDMATQVGEYIGGGSLEHFCDMMNEEAAALGCTNTHFANACGYPDDNNYTTCHDLAIISREALKNDMFRTLCSTDRYVIPATAMTDHDRVFETHIVMKNHPEYGYEGVFGGKTGYTDLAGNCLAVYCEKDGRTLISVIRKSPGQHELLTDSAKALEYGYTAYETISLVHPDFPDIVSSALVHKGVSQEMLTASESEETAEDGTTSHVFAYSEDGTEVGRILVPLEEYQRVQEEKEAAAAAAEAAAASEAEAAVITPTPVERPVVVEHRERNAFPRTLAEVPEWFDQPTNKLLAGILVLGLIALILGLGMYIGNSYKRAVRRRRKRQAKKRAKEREKQRKG